jgi:hypothetical protein
MADDDDWRDGVPRPLGAFIGSTAIAAIGWKAGAHAGHYVAQSLPDDLAGVDMDFLATGVEDLAMVGGLFAGAYIGYRLGIRSPAKSCAVALVGLAAMQSGQSILPAVGFGGVLSTAFGPDDVHSAFTHHDLAIADADPVANGDVGFDASTAFI